MTRSVVNPHAVGVVPGLSIQAHPFRLQLGGRLSRPLPALRTEELVHVKGLFAFQHVIDRPSQFVGEDRESFSLAVLSCKFLHESLSFWLALRNSTEASENAHFRCTLPIFLPE